MIIDTIKKNFTNHLFQQNEWLKKDLSKHKSKSILFVVGPIHYYPMLSIGLIPFTILIGLSRPILGLHYPSDVLVGALIGTLISLISFSII